MTEGTPHTAGPWEVSSGDIWAVSPWNARVKIASVTRFAPMNGIDAGANARLIAASPDLLAFARAYDAFMAAHYSGPDSGALHPDAAYNWRMCRAAIARAEGSAP